MKLLQDKVTDLAAGADRVRRSRYGVIECAAGQLRHVQLRLWPKIVTVDMVWWGQLAHRFAAGDRCRIYYNQPRACQGFLALKYALSSRDCTLRTIVRALAVLDQIACLKQVDAIVCDAWNPRISRRSTARFGWEPHLPDCWRRHYIKRFYGDYPLHARLG